MRDWEIEGNRVGTWDDEPGTIYYQITVGGNLTNGDYTYEQTSTNPDLD